MASQDRAAVSSCGTSLAEQPDVPPAAGPSADAMWRSQRDRFFLSEARTTTRLTLGLGVLVHLATLTILWQAGYPTWRVAALGGLYLAFSVAHKIVMGCTTESQRTASAFIQMNISAQLFVVGSAAITGGIHSPFVPSVILPAIISLLFFGPQAVARWMALGNGLLIIAMVLLPREVVGPALSPAPYGALVVIALAWNLFMLHLLVGKLSVVASKAGESMACLREERLADAEAQLRRLQSVGAKVAHELKNPLASIKGLCQLIARTPESARTQERLTVVAAEISRMETILGEYLSFSRPLEDIRPEPIQLATLARDVIDVLDGRAQQAGVALSFEGSAGPVQGDPRRLKEALINLVANAIEATPSGGRVALELKAAADADAAVLAVRDTGRGIAPEHLGRLGTSFFTTRPNGTGLGVVLAQGVIAQHGGSLAYVSNLGKGTTATILLPYERGEPVAAVTDAVAEPAEPAEPVEPVEPVAEPVAVPEPRRAAAERRA